MKLIGLISLVLLPFVVTAQVKQYNLRGYIGVPGGHSFNYRLIITDSANSLKGYSLTYDQENKDTKATVAMTIDRKKKTLCLRETEIVYNHGFESNGAIMCLVNATLKYADAQLSGPVVSKDAMNTDCGGGTINFINDDVLKQLFAEQSVPDTIPVVAKPAITKPSKPLRVVYDTARYVAPAKVSVPMPDKITSGEEKVYDWSSDEIVLDVWDGSRVDGDIITVLFNGKAVLSGYTLSNEKKKLHIPLSGKGTYTVTIIANNEGNESPNTADMLLTDGSKQFPIVAYNTVGKQAVIKIVKKN